MLRKAAPLSLFLLLCASAACAQDPEWVRTWEEAQKGRPRMIESVSRIAPAGEPGTALTVRGRVFRGDGTTPAPNVVVFAYQTDASGVYNTAGAAGWRLRGWARSGADGRFELHTIRPGSYPDGRVPAHVHVTIDGPGVPRQWTPELRFADDPFVSAREKEQSDAAGPFGGVRPVTKRGRAQLVEYNVRITGEGRF